MSKCKLSGNPSRIFSSIEISQGYILVTYDLHILSVLVGFQDFVMHFLKEVLYLDVTYIDDLPLLGYTHVVLGILSSCVVRRPFYLIWTIPLFSFFMSLLVGFDKKNM